MVNYFNSIYIEPSIYSIDMIRLKLDFSGSERVTNFGNFMSRVDLLYIEQYPQSFKAFSYRNLFKVTCSNDSSFVIGLSFNGTDSSSRYLGFMEFNPNKVGQQEEFKAVFAELMIHCFTAEVVRWDLAVDVPLARDLCILTKDKRKYTLVQNSRQDKTEYLGCHNKQGFVKLYNKKIESNLDDELTRLEITVSGKCTYSEFLELCPKIDVRGEQQNFNPYLDLPDTDVVLYELLMKCDLSERQEYFNRLGRRKKDLLKKYVFSNTYDSDKFVVPHVVFVQLKQQLRQYTIGVDYSILDNV